MTSTDAIKGIWNRAMLIERATFADHEWSAELVRVFGNQAGDARYDHRGTSTLALHALCCATLDAKRAAGIIE